MKLVILGHLYTLYTEYKYGKYTRNKESLERLADNLNISAPDKLILAGDYVHTADDECFEFLEMEFLNKLNVGMHSIYALKSSHEYKKLNYHRVSNNFKTNLRESESFWFFDDAPNLICFTPWKGDAKQKNCLSVSVDELDKLNNFVQKNKEHQKICVLPDLRYKDLRNGGALERLLERFHFIIIGDNEASHHNYGWFYLNNSDARVIMTGFPYGLKYQLGGIGSYIEITLAGGMVGEVKMIPYIEKFDSIIYEQDQKRIRQTWKKQSIIKRAVTELARKVDLN